METNTQQETWKYQILLYRHDVYIRKDTGYISQLRDTKMVTNRELISTLENLFDSSKSENEKLKEDNRLLLEALKTLVRDCTDNEDSFPVCPGITSIEKAKAAIKQVNQ